MREFDERIGGACGLMPWPAEMELSGQRLAAGGLCAAAGTDSGFAQALERICTLLRSGGTVLPVTFEIADARPATPALGDDESYALTIAPSGVVVRAVRVAGARHALTTLAQLAAESVDLPVGRIVDEPRFPWRGLMLDVARRFIGLPALMQVIDAMAFYKLNVLHLHLSDDQGFRLQSQAYPKLASEESYSARELRQLVRRATELGVRVIPELDMPGHVTSWLAAYPNWGPPRPLAGSGNHQNPAEDAHAAVAPSQRFGSNRVAPSQRMGSDPVAPNKHFAPVSVPPTNRFGPHPAVLNVADEAVYQAIDNLLGELADIFPDPYVHLGGDEVLPAWWTESPEVGTYMERLGLQDAVALQAHFNERVAELAADRGKRLIGWDEVLNGGAPDGMVVQAWRGATARERAYAAGHACVESSGYYLDLFYPADVHHAWDPAAPLAEALALEDAMLGDPRFAHVAEGMKWTRQWRAMPEELSQTAPAAGRNADSGMAMQEARQSSPRSVPTASGQNAAGGMTGIIGGEACLWSELVDEEVLPVRLWSRLPAIAERLWSVEPPQTELGSRLQASLEGLAKAGPVKVVETSRALLMKFGVLEEQLEAIELLEPVKWYGRLLGEVALQARIEGSEMPAARPYAADTPLNRPVDALLPESHAARRFTRLLDGDESVLRQTCARLLGICSTGTFVVELQAPVGKLADLLTIVLAVLDGGSDRDAALRSAAEAAKPAGEYIVAIAPPVLAWLAPP